MGKEHWVVCECCGKKFNVSKKGGRYNRSTRRYICAPCYRETTTGDKRSWFGKHWKIIVGILCVLSGFSAIGEYDFFTVVGCFGIGVALIVWFCMSKLRG